LSSARPKVAGYPFTTLHPHLGVVRVGERRSFVIADIPGVVAGAAQGAGLGLRFLKHLARTRLLLHLVDLAPLDETVDPADQVRTVEQELGEFGRDLARKERWLVLNKLDLLGASEYERRRAHLLDRLGWQGPVFGVSALTGQGTVELAEALMGRLEQIAPPPTAESEQADEGAWHPLR
jgi:GTP-binding protein